MKRKAEPTKQQDDPNVRPLSAKEPRRRHPIFGSMKGTVTIAPGVDLTEPAMPEWADLVDEKYGNRSDEEQR